MTAERFSPCPHDLVVPEERAAGKLAKGTRGQLRGGKPGAGKGKGGGKGRSTGGPIKTPPVKEKTRSRGPSGQRAGGCLCLELHHEPGSLHDPADGHHHRSCEQGRRRPDQHHGQRRLQRRDGPHDAHPRDVHPHAGDRVGPRCRDLRRPHGDLHAHKRARGGYRLHGHDHDRGDGSGGQRPGRQLRVELHHGRRTRRHAADGHHDRPCQQGDLRRDRYQGQRRVQRGDGSLDSHHHDVHADAGRAGGPGCRDLLRPPGDLQRRRPRSRPAPRTRPRSRPAPRP